MPDQHLGPVAGGLRLSDWQAYGLPHSQEQALGPWLCPGSEHANRVCVCTCVRLHKAGKCIDVPSPP